MSFPHYERYKESGVAWLGNVPEHWRAHRLKQLIVEPLMYGANEPAEEDNPEYPRFVRITDISLDGSLKADTFKSLSPDIALPYLLEEGDLLLARSGATVGKSFIYRESWGQCCFAGYLIRARMRSSALARFVHLFLQSQAYWNFVASEQIQSTIQNLSAERYGNLVVPYPPEQEQEQIVTFLDRETAKIDAAIEEQQRLIALLKEKRQATISHAVTKGLNSNAPLKDSGIEWMGRVPKHWTVERTRHLFNERDQRSTTGEEEMLTVSHLTGVTRRSEKTVNMFEAETNEGYKLCRAGELVINTLWGWMGAMGVAPEDGMVSPAYNVYEPTGRLLPGFIDPLVRTRAFVDEITRYSKGVWSSRLRIYPAEFFLIYMPVPPTEEQRAIAEAISKMNDETERLSFEAERGIALLQERRSALISAVVTGKIDVRSFAVDTSEVTETAYEPA